MAGALQRTEEAVDETRVGGGADAPRRVLARETKRTIHELVTKPLARRGARAFELATRVGEGAFARVARLFEQRFPLVIDALAHALPDESGVVVRGLDLLAQRLERGLGLVPVPLGLCDLPIAAVLGGEKQRQKEAEPHEHQRADSALPPNPRL